MVSLSASRDNQKARETHLGGALRCVSFILLFFLVRSLNRAANLTGFYRMRGEQQPYLNVQTAASSGPVCAFNTSLKLKFKSVIISEYMKERGFPQRPQVRCFAAFLFAEANLLL